MELDELLTLSQAGYSLIPVTPSSTHKRPAVRGFHGQDAPRVEPRQLESWYTQFKDHWWGVVTGPTSTPEGAPDGITVLDIDTKNGADGYASLDAFAPEWRADAERTRTITTPSGAGRHYVFAGTLATVVTDALGGNSGLDIRGEGGYVMAPGVIRANGLYSVENAGPIITPGSWFRALVEHRKTLRPLTPTAQAARRGDGEPETYEGVVKRVVQHATAIAANRDKGNRNSTLFEAACNCGEYAGAGQLTLDEVRSLLTPAIESLPLDLAELAAAMDTLERGLARGYANPRPWLKAHTDVTVATKAAVKALGQKLTQAKFNPVVPSPERMLEAVEAMSKAWAQPWGGLSLACEQADFFEWSPSRAFWRRLTKVDADNRVLRVLGQCSYAGANDQTRPWPTHPETVKAVKATLSASVLYRESFEAEGPQPYSGVYCQNGRVDIDSGVLSAPDPLLFNKSALPFAYAPQAEAPNWRAFLAQTLPQDSIDCLQEWFGYIVSGRKDLQKILCLIGKPRAGKGTITTVLEQLVGAEFVTSPRLGSMANNFGLEDLVGMSLAVFNEADWASARHTEAVAIIKGISGNDSQTIARKYQDPWRGRLDCRLMIVSNDAPMFNDPSGALAKRLIVLRFDNSFEGREDVDLGLKLRNELPGILNWALEGARRLDARGRFELPASARESKARAEAQGSITAQFVDEFAEFDPDSTVDGHTLMRAVHAWQDRDKVGRVPISMQAMLRELEALTGLSVERRRSNGRRTVLVHGLKPAYPGAFNDGLAGRA